MPFSSRNGKDFIRKIADCVPHKTVLDVGAGCGTYAVMFDSSIVTGIEIWGPYVEEYALRSIYDKLIVGDAREWHPAKDERYDIAIAGDVLEHMTVNEAHSLFSRMVSCADTVIISIPLGYYPQDEYAGNPYERHVKDDWSHDEVVRVFGKPDTFMIEGEIGVYVWSKHRVKPKICVYAISKNEAMFVDRFCEAAKDADAIFIADTGSTDDTVSLAQKHGVHVNEICITPWRFDHARNAALALIPKDFDICVSLDLDEVLQPGWREEIERVWHLGKTTRLRYMFDWGAGIAFKYEKIHARHGYYWHHPCHEYPVADGRIREVWSDTDMLLVIHKPDPTKSRGQYLDLLKLSVEEDPDCPRNGFYYARELSFNSLWGEAIEQCKRYLALPRANWPNERCYAYRVMGRSYDALGDHYNAERAFQMAAYEAPNTREPWCELAMLMYRQSRWEECLSAAMRALRIQSREMVYTVDPEVWGHQPYDLAAIAAWNIGIYDMALKYGEKALELSPNDERLKSNVRFYRAGRSE